MPVAFINMLFNDIRECRVDVLVVVFDFIGHDRTLMAGLVQATRSVINHGIGDVQPPLQLAVMENHLGLVNLFLAAGAQVNAQDAGGKTPLHYVKSSQVAQLLIAHGARELWDHDGGSPLHHVVRYVSKNDQAPILQRLLGAGLHATQPDRFGQLPWQYARDEAIKRLLAVAANVSLP